MYKFYIINVLCGCMLIISLEAKFDKGLKFIAVCLTLSLYVFTIPHYFTEDAKIDYSYLVDTWEKDIDWSNEDDVFAKMREHFNKDLGYQAFRCEKHNNHYIMRVYSTIEDKDIIFEHAIEEK